MNTHKETKTISVRLPKDLLSEIVKLYNPRGWLSTSEVIRQALLSSLPVGDQVYNNGGVPQQIITPQHYRFGERLGYEHIHFGTKETSEIILQQNTSWIVWLKDPGDQLCCLILTASKEYQSAKVFMVLQTIRSQPDFPDTINTWLKSQAMK